MMRRRKKIKTLAGWTVLLGNAVLALQAAAAPAVEPGIHPYLGASYGSDDNLLRFTDAAAARAVTGNDRMSDTFWRADGGLDVAAQLSEQFLSLKLNLNHTRYDHFDSLDFDGRDLQGLWNWRLGNRFDGDLGLNYARALTPFSDYHSLDRSLRTMRHAYFDANWNFHPSWSVGAGYAHDTVRYDLDSQRIGNRNDDTVQGGLRFEAPDNSTIGLQLMHTRGEFPDSNQLSVLSINNDYRQDAALAKLDWRFTPLSRLFVDAGWLRRRQETLDQRSFSGPVARMTLTTDASGKIALGLSAWREVAPSGDVSAIYTLNRGASISPAWNISSKLKLEAVLMNETLAYSGNPALVSLPELQQRRDRLQNATLTLSYAALSRLGISLAVYRDRRHSNVAQVPYLANGAVLNARYQF